MRMTGICRAAPNHVSDHRAGYLAVLKLSLTSIHSVLSLSGIPLRLSVARLTAVSDETWSRRSFSARRVPFWRLYQTIRGASSNGLQMYQDRPFAFEPVRRYPATR